MQPSVTFIGPLDTILGSPTVGGALLIEYVIFGVVIVNFLTRQLAHRSHVKQYKNDGAEAISRYLPHTITSGALVVTSFLFLVVEPHGGMVLSVLVVGMFVTDFFEFEARKVEARTDKPLERPNGSLVAAGLVLLYAGFQSLFSSSRVLGAPSSNTSSHATGVESRNIQDIHRRLTGDTLAGYLGPSRRRCASMPL